MGPRRFAVVGALCGTVVLASWVAARLAGVGSLGIENTRAPIEDRRATSVTSRAEHLTWRLAPRPPDTLKLSRRVRPWLWRSSVR
jgi:hypothetical protein